MAMRLTLRTLLAYLDRILEPADSAEMSKKVEESKAAAELVSRIREVTKKVRLGAPPVDGKGLGLDPNTVAEYLDNTMPAERMPDFELVCLDSDVHLAEVAACHEVLSLVLVKAAEIDPGMRQRLYDLPTAAAQAPRPEASAPITAVPVAAPIAAAAPPMQPEPARRFEVPDYLRQGADTLPKRRRTGALAAIVALVAIILALGTAALALVPRNSLPTALQPLAELLFPQPKVAEIDDKGSGDDPSESPTATGTKSSAASTAGGSSASTPTGLSTTPTGLAALPLPLPSSTSPAISTTTTGAMTSVAGLTQPGNALSPAAPPSSTTAPGALVPPLPPGTTAMPAATSAPTAVAMSTAAAIPVTVTPTATPTAAPVAQPVKIEPVGALKSAPAEIVLKFDPSIGSWVRLPAAATLMVGDRLLALPGCFPQLSLNNGLVIDMLGGTAVELLPMDASATPGLGMLRGRLKITSPAGSKAKLALTDGELQGMCTLGGAELRVEHLFRRPEGADPTTGGVPWVLNLSVATGDVEWAAPAPTRMPAGSQWSLTPAAPPLQLTGTMSIWPTADGRDALERQAWEFIELSLQGDKAVTVALKEAAAHRRIEFAELALLCLANLGEYDEFMAPLQDATIRPVTWDRCLQWLSESLDLGPYYAERVRSALVKQHGPDKGSRLYRMLWGYSDAQLQAGAAKELVDALDYPELDFRIVANWTLMQITGQNVGYQPQDATLKRKQTIPKWQQKLDAGQILHKK